MDQKIFTLYLAPEAGSSSVQRIVSFIPIDQSYVREPLL